MMRESQPRWWYTLSLVSSSPPWECVYCSGASIIVAGCTGPTAEVTPHCPRPIMHLYLTLAISRMKHLSIEFCFRSWRKEWASGSVFITEISHLGQVRFLCALERLIITICDFRQWRCLSSCVRGNHIDHFKYQGLKDIFISSLYFTKSIFLWYLNTILNNF